MPSPNEILKSVDTEGNLVGSGLLVDSNRHLCRINRLTLDNGISLSSSTGLDMMGQSIKRVAELDVDVLRCRQFFAEEKDVPPPLPPTSKTLSPPLEFPDDMAVDSIQCNTLIAGSAVLSKLPNAKYLGTDSSGNVVAVPAPVMAPAPAPALAPAPLPPNLVQCSISQPDIVPRFASEKGVLTASAMKIDSNGNMSGIQDLDCYKLHVADEIETDILKSGSLSSKTIMADRLVMGGKMHDLFLSNSLFVSNGPFQPLGVSGEGIYAVNLKIAETWSIYCHVFVGKTKTAYRSAFSMFGGVKSTQLEEHESDNGFDYVVMNLPEFAQISFGVEQKTGDFHIRSDQVNLISVEAALKKTSV